MRRPFHRRGRNANQPNPAVEAAKLFAEDETCPRCGKPLALCICDTVEKVDNEVEVLILQHPQEQDKLLGTARLAAVALAKATSRVGLSWPSLAKALGRPADPSRWAILYLGGSEENEPFNEPTEAEFEAARQRMQARAAAGRGSSKPAKRSKK